LHFSGQVELYETSNKIEIYIQTKQLCAGWNGGYAIEGIENASGTDAEIVLGRNFPSQWIASNDAVRFSPLCQCAVGINELIIQPAKIYPTPATSTLTLETNSTNHLST